MSPDPSKSPQFMLGEMYSDIKWLREQAETRLEVDDDHEVRLTSLEQFKFKLVTIVAAVGALFGFIFSNVKDGVSWLMNHLS
jgi:hypothetical protein